MSILNYFRRTDSASKDIFLPVPRDGEVLSSETVESANVCVEDLASQPASKHRKTTQYTYDVNCKHSPHQLCMYSHNLISHVLEKGRGSL